jgi:actin-related protein
MMYQKLKTEGKARATTLKVVASKERNHAAWNGGSVVAQMPNYAVRAWH